MSTSELAIGDGCGLKLELGGVMDIAGLNSGGEHPSRLRMLANKQARNLADATGGYVSPDSVGDHMTYIVESDRLQPGLDAGYHWIESLNTFSVSTTDAMTPPTSDPQVFGRIAALHVLSDLWVAGAPAETMQQYLILPTRFDPAVLDRILTGFKDTCDEFGVKRITGGHTRQDGDQYLVGGTVTGYTRQRLDTQMPRVGELIVATKALGTSVAIAAGKMAQLGTGEGIETVAAKAVHAAEASMTTANEVALRLRQERLVSMCTDITGFGLVGHLSNLVTPLSGGAVIHLDQLPLLESVTELVNAGVHTHTGDKLQIEHAEYQNDFGMLDDPRFHLAFMPETSGGVLATVGERTYEKIASIAKEAGQELTVIGEVTQADKPQKGDYRFKGITLV